MFSHRNNKIYTQTHSSQMLETYRIGVNKIIIWILTWILAGTFSSGSLHIETSSGIRVSDDSLGRNQTDRGYRSTSRASMDH